MGVRPMCLEGLAFLGTPLDVVQRAMPLKVRLQHGDFGTRTRESRSVDVRVEEA